jgi:hypothetical protein
MPDGISDLLSSLFLYIDKPSSLCLGWQMSFTVMDCGSGEFTENLVTSAFLTVAAWKKRLSLIFSGWLLTLDCSRP